MSKPSYNGIKFKDFGYSLFKKSITAVPLSDIVLIPVPKNPELELCSFVGDTVKRLSPIALPSENSGVLPVISPVEGNIISLEEQQHPLLGNTLCAVIEVNKKSKPFTQKNYAIENLTPDFIKDIAYSSAVVDEYDRTPLYEKLIEGEKGGYDSVVCDCVDDEPYALSNLKVLLEYSEQLEVAINLVKTATAVSNAEIAYHLPADFKVTPLVWVFGIKATRIEGHYPLRPYFTDKLDSKKPLMIGASALLSLYRAARHHIPAISGVLSVGGPLVPNKGIFEVTYGTPVSEILSHCKVDLSKAAVITGGLMRGTLCTDLSAPVVQGMRSITVIEREDYNAFGTCIGCGDCAAICPERLLPSVIVRAFETENFQDTAFFGAMDCTGCGCCSYICPCGYNVSKKLKQAKQFVLDSVKANDQKDRGA